MRCVSVSYSKDGYRLRVDEVPLRFLVIRHLAGWLLCTAMFHLPCCHTPEWTWKVGWGWNPEFEMLDHSLGSWLYNLTKLEMYGYRKETRVIEIPLTRDQVLEHFPEWRDSWPNDGGGDESDPERPVLPAEPGSDAMTVRRKDYRGRDKVTL